MKDIKLGEKIIKIGNSYYVTIPMQLVRSEVLNPKKPISAYAKHQN